MCEYCNTPPNVELKCNLILCGQYNIFDSEKKECCKVNYSNNICINQNINYCPMCGRNLKKG